MAELPSERFVSQFKSKAVKFPGGKQLLNVLEQNAGMFELILMFLEIHCGAQVESQIHESFETYIERRRSLASSLDDFADRLGGMADKLEQISSEREVVQELARRGKVPSSFPDQMRSHCSFLSTVAKGLRAVSWRTTPMDALNNLADCMIGGLGRPRKDLVLLLEIGFSALGTSKTIAPDTMKNALKRARKRREKNEEGEPFT